MINFELLNEAIDEAEAALVAKHNTAAAEVDMESGMVLGYGKVDGTWMLYVDNGHGRVRLRNKSVSVRVIAYNYLTLLKQAIAEAEATLAAQVDKATSGYQDAAKTLRDAS